MSISTEWILRNNNKTQNQDYINLCEAIMVKLGLGRRSAEILINRGCTSVAEATRYLNPSVNDLHDPFLFEDMEKVVDRILNARNNCEKICIYGDYDADGTIGVSILLKFMRNYGFDVSYFIPNRLITGYGLHLTPLQDLVNEGVSVIITVDNGISANEQIKFCNDNHVDVIVTDHHECHGVLPNAYGMINPKIPGSTYPFKELCGAGVAFKLVQALSTKLKIDLDHQESIECVALATVADLVPLQEENRCLVAMGLNYLNTSPRNLGIRALIDVSELTQLKAWHFGFVLGPKINAAGRLGEADHIVELLTGSDPEKLMSLAKFLSDENQKRQVLEKKILEEALSIVESQALYQNDVIIVVGENWHSGVIGIVASRIQEKYYNPVIVVSIKNGLGKASCRSVEGFNIFEALKFCGACFVSFGGHDQAAGFSIEEKEIAMMKERVIDYGRTVKLKTILQKKLYYDAEINAAEISWSTFNELALFEPCGLGNPGVQFVINNPEIASMGTMGKENNHLRLSLKNDIRGVGFGLGEFYTKQQDLSTHDGQGLGLLCRLDVNEYRGNKTLQLLIKDIKLNPIWQIDRAMLLVKTIVQDENPKKKINDIINTTHLKDLIVTIDTIRKVYILLKKSENSGLPIQGMDETNRKLSPYHILMSSEILREAGLIAYGVKEDRIFSKIIQTEEKKDIQNTQLMIKLEKMISD